MNPSEAGLLSEAARHAVKAGGHATLPATAAAPRTIRLAGQDLIYDILPIAATKHAVKLQCEAHLASSVSLVLSHPGEQASVLPGSIPRPAPGASPMRAAAISFGVGQSLHVIEVDVAEGTVVTLPTQVVEVSMLHYATDLEALPPGTTLRSQASAAYGTAVSMRAVKTMRALMPLGLFTNLGNDDPWPGGLGSVPALSDTDGDDEGDVIEAPFLAALPANHDAGDQRGAYQNALDRVAVLLPAPGGA